MKKTTTSLTMLLFVSLLFSGFNSNAQDNVSANDSEFELLVQHLESNGNFINSELAPALILAHEIKDNLKNKKYLTLDIRSASWFEYGHIKNAKNVKITKKMYKINADNIMKYVDIKKIPKITNEISNNVEEIII